MRVQLLVDGRVDIICSDGQRWRDSAKLGGRWRIQASGQLLLERRAEIMGKGEYGETELLPVAGEGHEAVVKLLLEKRADIMANCTVGETSVRLRGPVEDTM